MRRVLPILLLSAAMAWAAPARPPQQPKDGPGGANYPHAAMRVISRGEGGRQCWLFEPKDPMPSQKAPIIVFLHGFSVMEPDGYLGWIEHLVRRGNVVIYPRYQENLRERPADYLSNTISSVRAAMATLKEPGHVAVDGEKVVAVGHSAGAVLALKYTAMAAEEELPIPKAAVIVQPGQGPKNGVAILELPGPGRLPDELKLIVAVGDSDSIVGDGSARRVWTETANVRDRLFVTVQTDLHGEPRLRAGHLSPLAVEGELADALDWYGWWRLLDTACDAAFSGRPLQLDPGMGTWSDGQAMKPLKIERPTPP